MRPAWLAVGLETYPATATPPVRGSNFWPSVEKPFVNDNGVATPVKTGEPPQSYTGVLRHALYAFEPGQILTISGRPWTPGTWNLSSGRYGVVTPELYPYT